MGFFDWIRSFFGTEGYTSKQALHYVKKKYNKYKVIKPSDREDFEEIFLDLARNEISRNNRPLTEEEINPLAQRARIRQFQKIEREGIRVSPGSQDESLKGDVAEYKIKLFTKIIRERITPTLTKLGKNINDIEYLEAKYAQARAERKEEIFQNNKREFSDIEANIRSSIEELETAKKDLLPLALEPDIQAKLQEMILLWKGVGKTLQQARILDSTLGKVRMLGRINSTLRQEHNKMMASFIQSATKERDKEEDRLAA